VATPLSILRRVVTGNRVLEQIQDNVQAALNELWGKPILGVRLITGVQLRAVGDNSVDHGLGRKPLAYFVGGLGAQATVWTSPTPNTVADRSLLLRCSADVSVAILVL
jgi:hypothetical protein